jgi:hypothetical protein
MRDAVRPEFVRERLAHRQTRHLTRQAARLNAQLRG